MPWATEGEVAVNGAALHWYRTGSGPTVVLAHGVTDSGDCWATLVEALADAFDVVAYDARFHGLSTEGEEPEPFVGADLLGLVDGLGLERPAAVGHSMGAMTIAAAAAREPEALRAVVLEDPPWHATETGRQAMASALADGLPHLTDGTYDQILLRGKASNDWEEADLVGWARAKTQFRFDDWQRSGGIANSDWRADLKAMRCPALLICGEPDRFAIVAPEVAREAASLGADLRVLTLPAGHSIRREALEEYLSAVRRFLLETAGSPTSQE
ncbi:MAG: alpha/beta hydrolase [Acidimicrobiales bacterium]